MKGGYVYILASSRNGTLYIGVMISYEEFGSIKIRQLEVLLNDIMSKESYGMSNMILLKTPYNAKKH